MTSQIVQKQSGAKQAEDYVPQPDDEAETDTERASKAEGGGGPWQGQFQDAYTGRHG